MTPAATASPMMTAAATARKARDKVDNGPGPVFVLLRVAAAVAAAVSRAATSA